MCAHRHRPRAVVLISCALFAMLGLVALGGPPIQEDTTPLQTAGPTEWNPFAASVTLSENGAGPSSISLTWTQSSDLNFKNYSVEFTNASGGSWTTLAVIITASQTSYYVPRLAPSSTYWWMIVDCGGIPLGCANSNILQFTQPAAATLTYTLPTASSVLLSWNNTAHYGGMVQFGSYSVMESINGGPATMVSNITSVSTTSYTVNGLSSTTSYSFYIVTTDHCSGGGGYTPTNSNVVTFGTTAPLTAFASARPSAADVRELVSFSCLGTGGRSPYSYAWMFGDGATGTGSNPSHSYQFVGRMSVICTVLDKTGTSATSGVSLSVVADPTLTGPTASPSRVDLGQSVTFEVHASGGSAPYGYSWLGLPSGCTPSSGNYTVCMPSSSGNSSITLVLTDENGFSVTSGSLLFVTNSPPSITTFQATPSSFLVGAQLSLKVTVQGGVAPLTYAYVGLPPGCASVNASSLLCKPTASGGFQVTVSIRDALGATVYANAAVNVAPTFLGLPQTLGFAVLGAILAFVAAVAAWVAISIRRRHRERPKPPLPLMWPPGKEP